MILKNMATDTLLCDSLKYFEPLNHPGKSHLEVHYNMLLGSRGQALTKSRDLSTGLVWASYSKHGIGSNSNRWILPGFSHTLKGYTCVPALFLKFTPSPSSAVFYFLYFPPSKYQLHQCKVENSFKIEIQHWQMARMKQQNTFFLLY